MMSKERQQGSSRNVSGMLLVGYSKVAGSRDRMCGYTYTVQTSMSLLGQLKKSEEALFCPTI